MINCTNAFQELVRKLSSLLENKALEIQNSINYLLPFRSIIRLENIQREIVKPLCRELLGDLLTIVQVKPFDVTDDDWIEKALLDYISLADPFFVFSDSWKPTEKSIEKATMLLVEDLDTYVPAKRALTIVDKVILEKPIIDLDDKHRIRRLTRFELYMMKQDAIFQYLNVSDGVFSHDELETVYIIEYFLPDDIETRSLIQSNEPRESIANALQNVLMGLRLFRNSEVSISDIWVQVWDSRGRFITMIDTRPELKKGGFPTWTYSRMLNIPSRGMTPPLRLPVELGGESIEQLRRFWNLFSEFRTSTPYTRFQESYQIALFQYNKLISEDSPDTAANVLSSAIDAFGRKDTNRSSYYHLINLLAHGSSEERISRIINLYQTEVRNKIEHGERIDEENYSTLYEMGNIFRAALSYAIFLFDRFGVFPTRESFYKYVEEYKDEIPSIIPNWAQLVM